MTNRYRYQLEAFVDKVRGRKPQHWIDGSDSVADMVWIENVYKAVSSPLYRLDVIGTDSFALFSSA